MSMSAEYWLSYFNSVVMRNSELRVVQQGQGQAQQQW